MKLTLLNKNTPIADIDFNTRRGGFISGIVKEHNPEFAPLGIVNDNKHIELDALSDWWEDRCIPDSRKDIEKILEYIQKDKHELIIQSLGLSLSDQYWVKPIESDIKWSDINFFNHSFSEKVGDVFSKKEIASEKALAFSSPDYTTNGFLDKKWMIENNDRFLIKSGHGPFYQQAYNEVISSRILKQIQCENFVNYELFQDNEHHNSVCKNFINENTEYVPASLIRKRLLKIESESHYEHFIRCCDIFGFARKMQDELDYTLMFDYLVANIDRNFGNFGVIRNVETLKIEQIAPIFDNGNCLWYDSLKFEQNVKSYPFALSQNEQIKFVRNFMKFPLSELKDLDKICSDILKLNPFCDKQRITDIANKLLERKEMLSKIIDKNMNRAR